MAMKKLETLDRRYVWLIVIIVCSLVLIFPLGLPITVGGASKKYYNAVAATPDGGIVLVQLDMGMGVYRVPEAWPTFVGTMKQLAAKHMKFVIMCWGQSYDSSLMFETAIAAGDIPFKQLTYGVDYVDIGWVGGGETGMSSWAKDIWGAKPYDYFGTPFSQLPLMANVHSAKDFNFYHISSHVIGDVDANIRQITTVYGLKPVIAAPASQMGPNQIYVSSGQALACLAGARQGAEYEKLLGSSGLGLATMDSLTLLTIITVIGIGISNIPIIEGLFHKKEKTGKSATMQFY